MDRCSRRKVAGGEAVHFCTGSKVNILPWTKRHGKPGEHRDNEGIRRDVLGQAFLRFTKDDILVERKRLRGEPQTCREAHEDYGHKSNCAGSSHEQTSSGKQGISVPSERNEDTDARQSLVCGHNVCSDAARLHVPCCDHGLVQPVCYRMGHIKLSGCAVLHGGVGEGIGAWHAGDIQYRSRRSIHLRGVHRSFAASASADKYGWEGQSDGQPDDRAFMAQREVRGYLRYGLCGWKGTIRWIDSLFPFLQYAALSPVVRKSDAGTSLFRQGRKFFRAAPLPPKGAGGGRRREERKRGGRNSISNLNYTKNCPKNGVKLNI